MRESDKGCDVELDYFELAIEIEFDEVAHRAETGVVDEHFNLQLTFLCFFEELRGGVRLLQVECNVLRANAGQTSELVAQRDEFVFGASDEQNVSAAGGELSGEGRSNS